MSLMLKYVPHEAKKCDCLKKALAYVPNITNVVIADNQVTMTFKGDWDELCRVEYAAANARTKAALVLPAQFCIDFAVDKVSATKPLLEAIAKIPGVLKAFIEDGKLYVFGSVDSVDPRMFATEIKTAGFRYVAIKSHRFRTLSYEAWEAKNQAETLRQAIQKLPGVLRVDLDTATKTISVLMIRDTQKDLALVSIGEEAGFTIFPGKAEEEDEPTKDGVPAPTEKK